MQVTGGELTVFNEKMLITLSQQVPSFGSHAIFLLRALARHSDRWKKSLVEKDRPVRPHVNGLRLFEIGHLPYFSWLMNSEIVIESGGSVTSLL